MKKIKQKGFTLIELLAVITIMGILLLVAIPAVSRIIENSRRDTFATVAKEYLNAVRTAYTADNIKCYISDTGWVNASSLPDGTYIFPICTSGTEGNCSTYGKEGNALNYSATEIAQNTKDLMESGGKSPFGNAELRGYVRIDKKIDKTNVDNPNTTVSYSIRLSDAGRHGLKETKEDEIKRSAVLTSGAGFSNALKIDDTYVLPCRLA